MKRANYITGLIGVVVGAVFLIVGREYRTASVDGGYTTAATWPTIISWVMIGLSCLLIVSTAVTKGGQSCGVQFNSPQFRGVLLMMLFLSAYYLSFRYLGCLITNAIFLPLMLIAFGERRPLFIGIFDVGALVVIYLLFQVVLESRLAPPFFA